jgi:hypothetical protein
MKFDNTLIRCSSIHKIMSDGPGSKGMSEYQVGRMNELWDRHNDPLAKPLTNKQLVELADLRERNANPPDPELGKTAKTELRDIYLFEKFGLRSLDKDKMIMYTEKGRMVEQEAIDLLSEADKIPYKKNGDRINNEWITGEPDIIRDDLIIDIKSSWDADSFLANLDEPLNPHYWWQMQGYMALKELRKAQVCYCLVDTPQTLVNDEKRRLFYAMGVSSEEDPVYELLAESIQYNMNFSWIPKHLRIMRFNVDRDDAAIQRIYRRVEKCRKWLEKLDYMHENMIK